MIIGAIIAGLLIFSLLLQTIAASPKTELLPDPAQEAGIGSEFDTDSLSDIATGVSEPLPPSLRPEVLAAEALDADALEADALRGDARWNGDGSDIAWDAELFGMPVAAALNATGDPAEPAEPSGRHAFPSDTPVLRKGATLVSDLEDAALVTSRTAA
jgi:hypothetical protein